jgi:hypothetical protein
MLVKNQGAEAGQAGGKWFGRALTLWKGTDDVTFSAQSYGLW